MFHMVLSCVLTLVTEDQGIDMSVVRARIDEVVRILNNFAEERDGVHSRKEYVQLLKNDMSFYFGYTMFLLDRFIQLFPPSEVRVTCHRSSEIRLTIGAVVGVLGGQRTTASSHHPHQHTQDPQKGLGPSTHRPWSWCRCYWVESSRCSSVRQHCAYWYVALSRWK